MAAETDAQVGSGNDKSQQIESNGADGVVEGLGWRMHRIDKVEDAETGGPVKEQDYWMKDGKC